MAIFSPTVIRVAGIVLVLGTALFIITGIAGRTEDESAGRAALIAFVFGAPVSSVVGVLAGYIWERLFGPIKSVEHLDMRKGRQRRVEQPREPDAAAPAETPSQRRYTGKGGGRRRK
jgi:Na+/H+-dicarboxylate symporter